MSKSAQITYEIEGVNDGDPRPIGGLDPHDAAQRAVEDHEQRSAEFPVAAGQVTLRVRVTSPGRVDLFEVSGECVPTYRARWLRPEE